MKHILIVTPAGRESRKGNWFTAERWARIIRSLGYRVSIAGQYTDQRPDALIALHARKSATAVRRFRAVFPDRPIWLALTGTDLYRDLATSRAAQRSLELADRLIVLQELARRSLPRASHRKLRVIHQSAEPVSPKPRPLQGVFEVCVSGHLRAVKDPFRAALAVRALPADSRIRLTHLGGALTPALQARAMAEMQRNARYQWYDNVPHGKARRLLARSRVLAITSKLEGCPTVLSEALACDVPVVATRIDGNIGLLGEDYGGYFQVGDTKGLRNLLLRCETDRAFYAQLQRQCREKSGLVEPAKELDAWERLLAELG